MASANRSDQRLTHGQCRCLQAVEFTDAVGNLAGRSVRRHPDRHVMQGLPRFHPYHASLSGTRPVESADPSAEPPVIICPNCATIPSQRVIAAASRASPTVVAGGTGLLPCPVLDIPTPVRW